MEKGEVRFSGPTAELLERGDILRSVFLEGAGTWGAGPLGRPRPPRRRRREPPRCSGRRSWRSSGLSKHFGGIAAVDDVSFDLHPGQILGLIGPNGAGKTTIFDLISGLPADGGRIWLSGTDVTSWGPDRRAALGLGRSFQDARIFPSLTVAENIAIGLERHLEVRDHLAALLDLPAVQEEEEDVAYTVDDLIELMSLGAFRDKFVPSCRPGHAGSSTWRWRSPTTPRCSCSTSRRRASRSARPRRSARCCKRIQAETGCAMLVIEHDMPLITSVSDEIIALELGAVVLRGTPQEVTSDPRVISSYLGGDIGIIQRSGGDGRRGG